MSGRLVISRHKTWHVWNQDCREKVMRDERIHAEQQAALAEKKKQLALEFNHQVLTGGIEQAIEEKVAINEEVKPFRLFEDLEKKNTGIYENEEYVKEKKLKERLKKKREGVEDWALGDGSFESSKIKPWYEIKQEKSDEIQIPVSLSTKQLDINQILLAKDREINRKFQSDPMSKFLHNDNNNNDFNYTKIKTEKTDEGIKDKNDYYRDHGLVDNTTNNTYITDVIECKSNKDSKKKKRKKDKSSKEHKKRSKHNDDNNNNKSNNSNSDNSSNEEESNQKSEYNDHLEMLRKKRLEREKVEKKRSDMLLAKIDIYGPSSIKKSYSQQYNPHIARNNATR